MFQGHCCFAVKDKIFFFLSRVITAPDVVLITHMQTEGHRHVWCDITKWTDECTGARWPASANNGTWGKLLALFKSIHLHLHNLMIIVKIKAISQGSCETQILRCFKAFGKVSKTCMGLLRWVSRSKVQYLFLLVFSLYSIVVIGQSRAYSYPSVMVNHTDRLDFSCHFSV